MEIRMITKYPYLFSPLKINQLMLKNRIIAAPMGVPKATLISTTYYGGLSLYDKSLGGAAVITVSDYGMAGIVHEKSAFNKYARDVTREVLSVMRQAGGLAQIEMGFHSTQNEDGSFQGPSDGVYFTGAPMRAMTHDEMKLKIDAMCKAVCDARDFGFDMAMLHFGHDSLCSVFMSPAWNQRTDEYGGSLENRTRFPREALKAVREAVGPDFPLLVRISRELKVPETYTEDDVLYFIKTIEKYIDIINVSCGMDCYGGTIEKYVANTYAHSTIFLPRMYNLNFCERVKKECNVLVCIVGGVSDPKECDDAIAAGKVDAVMLGRQLVADPFWPKKAQEGKDDEIVPCLRCLNCYHISTVHTNVQCSVNPRLRRENRVPLELAKTSSPKHVVIIGGGPAGMKAAITADERGHNVVLVEKAQELGGNLKYSEYGDYKEDMKKYLKYLKNGIAKSNVDVKINTTATNDYVKSLNPDALIIAVGAEFITPNIPGVEFAKQAADIYRELDDIHGEVVIIGGGAIGSEIGLELSNRGNKVTVVEQNSVLAQRSNWLYRHGLYNTLKESNNLTAKLETTVKEIRNNGVVVVDKDGKEEFIPAKHVLLAVGMKPKKDLVSSFFGITPETSVIGDCHSVAQILEATNDAYFIAANL
jgi:2,4-dienoyl-CoA reductase-like NADH-dependent reductase (Old Yellow Enzyme family)/thioredoxin reductase